MFDTNNGKRHLMYKEWINRGKYCGSRLVLCICRHTHTHTRHRWTTTTHQCRVLCDNSCSWAEGRADRARVLVHAYARVQKSGVARLEIWRARSWKVRQLLIQLAWRWLTLWMCECASSEYPRPGHMHELVYGWTCFISTGRENNIILPSSGLLRSVRWFAADVSGLLRLEWSSCPLGQQMEQTGSPETSVSNNITSRNNLEDGRIRYNRGGSFRSRT